MDEFQKLGEMVSDTDMRTRYVVRPDRVYVDMRPALKECTALGRISYKRGYSPLPAHRHPGVAEIILWKSESQPMRIDGRGVVLRGGSMALIPPGAEHSTDGAPSYPGVRYWIHVRLPSPGDRRWLGMAKDEYAPVAKLLSGAKCRIVDFNADLTDRLDGILAFFRAPDDLFRADKFELARMRTRLLAVIFDVCEQLSCDDSRGEAMRGIVERCMELDDASANMPSVGDLAAVCSVTKARLDDVFRRQTGTTPHSFFLRRRVEKAERMLLGGTVGISAVADVCGFKSPQHFAKVFKKKTGVSPSCYARKMSSVMPFSSDGQT